MAMQALLAQVELEPALFVNPIKLAVMFVLFLWFALTLQWSDKDALRVNTFRILWNLVLMGAGIVAFLAVVFIPNFLIGAPIYVVVFGAASIAYVLHRNGLVVEDDKVMTPAHIKKIITEGFSKKEEKQKEVKVRVRIKGANGKRVELPDDNDGREQFGLTQDLLWDVLWHRAERAEVAPGKEGQTRVAYLVDGMATARDPIPQEDFDRILPYLKTIAGLDLEEKRKPQKGKINTTIGDQKVDIEIRTDGSNVGEKLTLRVIGKETTFKAGDIGLTQAQMDAFAEFREQGRGLVIVSAPPKSGLTTSLYALARSHDAFLNNLQTLEYEVELKLDNVTQTRFQPGGDKNFTEDLQRLFRADPDIVIIPEIREEASAVIITNAANKRQLVSVGINASDNLSALKKWLDMVNDAESVAKCLLGVSNQRLVRKLCPSCREGYKPDAATLKRLNLPADATLYRQPEPEYDKKGNPIICQYCQGSGYVGRTAIFDLLVVDGGMRKTIATAKDMKEIQAFAAKQGGGGLTRSAIQKVLDGETSIAEITRVLKGDSRGKSPAKRAAKPAPVQS